MKKSGIRPLARAPAAGSLELLDIAVTPLAHEVATQVLAKRLDLPLEALSQLAHERLVDGRRRAIDDAAPERCQQPATRAPRDRRRDGTLQPARDRAAPDDNRVHEFVQGLRTAANGGIDLPPVQR